MHLPLLNDLLILLGFSVVIVFLLQRLKLPAILGFLITGALIGPYGFSLVHEVEEVEVISEIGVILLLFVIGMELSIKQLASIRRTVFIGGFLQVGLTIAVSALVYYSLGFPWNEAVFVGFLFSLSSTAIVLKILQDRNEISSPHGRNALAILIFQDIIVVPMMLLTPILAGEGDNVALSIGTLLLKTALVIAITIISARYLIPRLLHAIARTRNKELFLLATITICFAVAALTSEAGLSLALGAFLAGLIISESDYSHQATSIILPFRELFTSFFFISVGMLLDIGFFLEHVGVILLLVLAVFFVKSILGAAAVAVLRHPPRTALLTGLALFQVGEFAFILSKVGIAYNLISAETNQYFLAVSIVTMLLTPFVILASESIAGQLMKTRLAKTMKKRAKAGPAVDTEALENHLVIIGYGINGSNLAKAARFSDIPYVVIELNAETVRQEQKNKIPILFGDATQYHILEMVHVNKARAVVVAISDPAATRAITRNIRALCQTVFVLVRTRYVHEIPELIALGADEVIPEEFETSVEIFSRVLHNFLVPEDDIEDFVKTIRSDNYHLFQTQKVRPQTFRQSRIPNFNITCLRVNADSGSLVGKTIKDADIRARFGVNILAISRQDEIIDLHPEQKIMQQDILYLHGNPEQIDRFHKALNL